MEDEDDAYWSGSSKSRRRIFDDDEPPPSMTSEKSKGMTKNASFDSRMKELGLGDDQADYGRATSARPRPSSVRGTVSASQPPAALSAANGSVRYSKRGASEADSVSVSSTGSSHHSSEPTHRRSSSDAGGKARILDKNSSPSTLSVDSTSSTEESRRDIKPSYTEMAKILAEKKSLEREIVTLKRSKFSSMSVTDTVTNIILGERYSLESYKLLREKLALLDSVVGFHDGNAILARYFLESYNLLRDELALLDIAVGFGDSNVIAAVVIFLKKTLSKSLFHEELRKRPHAVNQYIAFLKRQKNDDVAREMMRLGRSEEASMWRFREATEKAGAEERQKAVLDSYSWARGMEAGYEAEMMNEYSSLLYKQNKIEPADAQAQMEGRPPFNLLPRKAKLYFQPLITTLFYCCLYHYTEHETSGSSPLALKKEFKLTEKQYLYTALRARCTGRDWDSIDALFTAKNWRGKAKFKAPMKFEKVVETLASMRAGQDVLDKYLFLVEDTDVRIQLGERYKCHRVVIDTLAELKDRQKLESYRQNIKNTQPENYLQTVLDRPNIKWKN